MDEPVTCVDEVTKQFRDGTKALDKLSLAIPPGVIYGLLGPMFLALTRGANAAPLQAGRTA